MTADDFRRLALSQPGAVEQSHMGHPDFRASGRIFATLGYPDGSFGMVSLAPEDQRIFIDRAPDVFRPVPGAWGLKGATHVVLAAADEDLVAEALALAVTKVNAKKPPRARAKRPRV